MYYISVYYYYYYCYILRTVITKTHHFKICVKYLLRKLGDHFCPHNYSYSWFVDLNNKGVLVLSSESVFKVVHESEKLLISLANHLTQIKVKN